MRKTVTLIILILVFLTIIPYARSFILETHSTIYSDSSATTKHSFQRHIFYDGNYYWAFFKNSSDILYCYSQDGSSWSTPTIVASGSVIDFSIWFESETNTVHLIYGNSTDHKGYYRNGTITGNVINWNSPVVANSYGSLSGDSNYATIIVTDQGTLWAAMTKCRYDGSNLWYSIQLFRSTDKGNTWTTDYTGWRTPESLNKLNTYGFVVPLEGDKVWLIYHLGGTNNIGFYWWSGSLFNYHDTKISDAKDIYAGVTAISVGTYIYVVYVNASDYLKFAVYKPSGTSLTTIVSPQNIDFGAISKPVLIKHEANRTLFLHLFYIKNTNIYHSWWNNQTQVWSTPVIVNATTTTPDHLSATYETTNRIGCLMWMETPNIKFLSFYSNYAPRNHVKSTYAKAIIEFYLNATVTDYDTVSEIQNVTLQLDGGIVLRWSKGEGFVEVADPNNYVTLGENSFHSYLNSSSIKLCFALTLTWDYSYGYHNITVLSYDNKNSTQTTFTNILFFDNEPEKQEGAPGGGPGASPGTPPSISVPLPKPSKTNTVTVGLVAIVALIGGAMVYGEVRKRKSVSKLWKSILNLNLEVKWPKTKSEKIKWKKKKRWFE